MRLPVFSRLDDGPEVFESVQGEGASLGVPSVFIRFSGCNLYCGWCDTPYTWNWAGTDFTHADDAPGRPAKYERTQEQVTCSVAKIVERVRGLRPTNLVFTGGEPLLQPAAIAAIVRELRAVDAEYRVEIETNGTLLPPAELDALVDQYNVSPKLANSGVREQHRLRPALEDFARKRNAFFKLVVEAPSDLDEVEALVERYLLPKARVFLMCAARDLAALEARQGWLADACVQRGFRYGDRLHIRVFGAARGT